MAASLPAAASSTVPDRDLLLVFATSGIRNFAYGISSVMLGLYLANLGLDKATIGFVFAAALGGGACITVALSSLADHYGRRRMLRLSALVMALAAAGFALARQPALLAVAAAFGAVNPSGKEV